MEKKRKLKFTFNMALFLIWAVIFAAISLMSPSFLKPEYIMLGGAAIDLKAKDYGIDKPANIVFVSGSGTDENQTAREEVIYELLKTDEYSFKTIKNKETDVYYPGTDETTVNSECSCYTKCFKNLY